MAMMSPLSWNPLLEKANELRALKAQHEEVMAMIRSLILGFNAFRTGEAQDAFVAKYESMQPTFNSFSEMLENYAKLMEISAQQLLEETEKLTPPTCVY